MYCEICGELLEVEGDERLSIWKCPSCGHVHDVHPKKRFSEWGAFLNNNQDLFIYHRPALRLIKGLKT